MAQAWRVNDEMKSGCQHLARIGQGTAFCKFVNIWLQLFRDSRCVKQSSPPPTMCSWASVFSTTSILISTMTPEQMNFIQAPQHPIGLLRVAVYRSSDRLPFVLYFAVQQLNVLDNIMPLETCTVTFNHFFEVLCM